MAKIRSAVDPHPCQAILNLCRALEREGSSEIDLVDALMVVAINGAVRLRGPEGARAILLKGADLVTAYCEGRWPTDDRDRRRH